MKNHVAKTAQAGNRPGTFGSLFGAAKAKLILAFGLALGLMTVAQAAPPGHNISAGNITVVYHDSANTVNSVSTSTSLSINDFRVRGNGGPGADSFAPENSNGDYGVQIGSDPTDDFTNGILMVSITQNGRDNGTGNGTNYCVVMMDNQRTNGNPNTLVGAYLIDVSAANGAAAGSNPEYDINVAGAWFPYNQFYGGFARNSGATNGMAGVTMNELIATPGLAIGTNFFDLGSNGKFFVTLTNLGIDSRTDGIMLAAGAKNESANFGMCQANTNNGGWNLWIRDDGGTSITTFEEDPIAFVFIPKTNTTVVSGRFTGSGGIQMFSGASPAFTVTSNSVGTFELKIPGKSPTNGVLIISCEGGGPINADNFVTYEVNAAGDGWIIQSRDCPLAGLESPGANEPVASFVYIPGPTPGFTVTPTNNLFTSENGTTATFTVVLDKQPTDTVTIPVSSSNTGEGVVDQSSLTFTPANWNVPQTVTITGVDDNVVDGTINYTIILSPATSTDAQYNGLDPVDVSAANLDNDGGISVSPTSGLTTTEAGGTATFTVVLNAQPTANVTIPISSSNTGEGTVSPSSLTFTPVNWATGQIVTITGVNDFVQDGNKAYTIITGVASSTDPNFNGLNPSDVSVVNIDDDVAGVTVSASGPAGVSVVEGHTTSYTVVLTSQPIANVTVNVASSNPSTGGTVSPGTLTFTSVNWSNAQTVTITAADDLIVDGNRAWTITNTISSSDPLYAAIAPIPVLMTTLDNEPVVSLPSGTMIYGIGQAGVGIDGAATIADPNTANYPGGTLTVSLTANGTSDDRLEIRNTGTGAGQIGVSGNNVSYGGVNIGTFAGGVGTSALVITFNSTATPVSAQALLDSVTFRNVNAAPSRATRTAVVTLAHADGGVGTATEKIRVGLLRAIDFQEGADHGYGLYTGENDIQLRQSLPDTAFPAGNPAPTGLFVDYPDPGQNDAYQTLMRFDNMFGSGFGQIPTNAIIVSADYTLFFTDTGDGSPLYRMLIPFDATNETWNTMGGGVAQDDVESSSTFSSQIGVSDGSGSTSTGFGTVTVTPDVVAWQQGQANYGWVLPGWVGNLDGTGISPSEATNMTQRPRMRVLWLPAGSVTEASFRQNVNGYTNTVDTRIRAISPDTSYATVTTVFSDWAVSSTSDNEQVLMRFDDIIGGATNQVPAGAEVEAAVLDLASTASNAMGDGGTFHPMLIPWQDTNTWNSFGGGLAADDVKAVAASSYDVGSPTFTPFVQGGYHSFELSGDVQAWVSGTRPNYGWTILPWSGGSDGWGIQTSEAAIQPVGNNTQNDRPQLRVYYTFVPVLRISSVTPGPSSVVIQFVGPASTLLSVRRSATVTGTYSVIGTATTQPDGTATFTDNSPLSGKAFYRISNP